MIPQYLPFSPAIGTGGGTGIPVGPAAPFNTIPLQDAFELPFDWATDGSKQFTLFIARPDPDAQGATDWASDESPPVDYNEVDTDALFCAGGVIDGYVPPRFTMDRLATINFTASSQDIDTWQSVSDNAWMGLQFLVLLGGDDTALLFAAENLIFLGGNSWQIQGLWGPLSDTIGGVQGNNVWIFALQPPYRFPGQPAWVTGATITFKAIPFGTRLSPTLSAAPAVQHVVSSRASRPRMVQNARANAVAAIFGPTYSTDIALSWDLCNRAFGFGAETNPSPFDPTIPSEVQQCQVDVVGGGRVLRTAIVSVRPYASTTIAAGTITQQTFPVADASNLQPGDAISIFHGGGEWFGRIQSIVGMQLTLISPLAIAPSSGDTLNRYEAIGYVYDQATSEADNGGSLPDSVTFNIYAYMNGLRSLRAAAITVVKS